MEKLIVLGTGNASVTKCYNTCSIIQDEKGKYFMIDARSEEHTSELQSH